MPAVLVVDVGAAFGLSLIRSLRAYCYDVRLVTSPEHAVRTVQARRIDFMVVYDDLQGRGRAALARVRGVNRQLPAGLVDAEPIDEAMRKFDHELSPLEHFGQPLDLLQIVAAIGRALVPAESQPERPLSSIPFTERPTREGLRAMESVETIEVSDAEPPRQPPRTGDCSEELAVDPPPFPTHRQRTARMRPPDAGVYCLVNQQRTLSARSGTT